MAPAARPDARASKEDIPPEAATGFRSLEGVHSGGYMVGAAHPRAARAGFQMLQAGGSAVDAAVAMAAMLTLVEPQSSGIGGGAFLLHWDAASGQLRAYDGRETAPQAATADQFLDGTGAPRAFREAVVGGLSVGVPGELRMLELAHRAHGKLPWKQLFQPAIELAAAGFPISPRLHALLAGRPRLSQVAPASRYFFQADGKPKPVGTRLVNRELADTLRIIAEEGAGSFYDGPIAQDIAAAVARAPQNPGRLTVDDLRRYRAVQREPLCANYRSYRVCGLPPPSGGITVMQILGLLQRFDLRSMDGSSLQIAHLFAEAGRLAYADRAVYLADPAFVKVPVDELIHPAYLARRSQLIAADRSMGRVAAGQPARRGASLWAPDASLELPSTTHLVVVDGAGRSVSMTASIESAFGSHLMVRGFLLNNELTDFSFVPRADGAPVANRVQPGKRPRSSMAPIIVLRDGGTVFHLALGAPGGSRIPAYVAQVLIHVLDFGHDIQRAIAAPHVVNRNGVTEVERYDGKQGLAGDLVAGLRALGHQVVVRDLNSGLHGIVHLPDGSFRGGADPRREGQVLGADPGARPAVAP